MRGENTSLTKDENFLLTGSIGLIGGTFLTSDYPSQWDAQAEKAVDLFWTKEGPRIPYKHFVLYDDQNNIKAYLVSYNDGKKPDHRLGIYNWESSEQNTKILISDLQLDHSLKWNVSALIQNHKVGYSNGEVLVASQPAHSLSIVNLTDE